MRAAHNEERDTRSFPAKRSNVQYIRIIIYQLNRTWPTHGSAQRTSGNTSGVTYTLYNNQTRFSKKFTSAHEDSAHEDKGTAKGITDQTPMRQRIRYTYTYSQLGRIHWTYTEQRIRCIMELKPWVFSPAHRRWPPSWFWLLWNYVLTSGHTIAALSNFLKKVIKKYPKH